MPDQQFKIWIRPLRLEGEETPGDGLRLIAPNGIFLKWIKEKYLGRIEEMSREFFSMPVNISLTIDQRKSPAAAKQNLSRPSVPAAVEPPLTAEAVQENPAASSSSPIAHEKAQLLPNFTFDNLIVGKANDMARAASIQVANNPGGSSYNPLFIYGGAGLGKTHLIHAIGNHILTHNPTKKVRYVHANDYRSEYIRSLNKDAVESFERYYRSLDVLLIDDVQFFDRKKATQERFFIVFNALIDSKKLIVISCDTYPKNISGLEDRLITRFDCGLTVQIEPPETEMRVAILKKKAEMKGIALADEVAFYIAKHLRSNVRELEGALIKVLAYASFYNRTIDLELTKEALKDLIGAVNRHITVENIQKTVADYFRIKVADLYSQKRSRQIARPRQIAMWLAKNLTSLSYPAIGDAFGGRDHTTVLHAVRTIESLRGKDNELNHAVHFLLQVLKVQLEDNSRL